MYCDHWKRGIIILVSAFVIFGIAYYWSIFLLVRIPATVLIVLLAEMGFWIWQMYDAGKIAHKQASRVRGSLDPNWKPNL